MKKKPDPSERILPALAIRLEQLAAMPEPDFESMQESGIDTYCQENGINISPISEKRFASILQDVRARIRLEDAEAKLAAREKTPSILESLAHQIAAMPLAEVLREIKNQLNTPGVSTEVYARNLEQATEEDLRSLLLDLKRCKKDEGT